jgi:[ribosomal protein S5]-alanine N-acetyltransferase
MGEDRGVPVTISPPTKADGPEWVARARASRRLHRPWIVMPDTPEAYAAYLERARDPRRAFYVVRRVEDGALVGFANLSEIIRGGLQQAFLGFGAFAGGEGRGHMTDALALVLRDAFTTHRLHRVEANIQPANAASKALAARAGLRCEGFSERYLKVGGRWRDHERWAITKEAWRAQRSRSASRGGPTTTVSG